MLAVHRQLVTLDGVDDEPYQRVPRPPAATNMTSTSPQPDTHDDVPSTTQSSPTGPGPQTRFFRKETTERQASPALTPQSARSHRSRPGDGATASSVPGQAHGLSQHERGGQAPTSQDLDHRPHGVR